MKKMLSLMLSAVMLLLSFQITIFAEETTQNLLSDAGFENGALSNANSWKFTGGTNWYGYGDAGNLGIETAITHSGEKSAMLKNAMIGQRVKLEAGKKYKLSAQIYSTEFYSAVDMGFYDGAKEWPGSNAVKVQNNSFDWENDWGEASVIFNCEKTQDYIIGFYENSTTLYIDDVVLCETEEEEVSQYMVEGDYNAVSGNYDKDRLLNVSRGGYLINRNKYWMPSLYDKMSEDGVNMVRMDWILSDQFYHIVSTDESGNLTFNFELLDAAILPLLEKGMTPFMCMTAFPSVLGGTKNRGENTNGLSSAQLAKFGECVEAVVKHYVDMGYTGWYWESDNEPEDGKTGNVSKICEKYGVFAKAVQKVDPTAKIGGIGFRNSDVNKETSWKTTFFTYLKNNPDIPFDFISIHQYNKVINFEAADAFAELLEQTAPERKDIPVIFSEWNYDWTTKQIGSEKDTNINAAYSAKRLSTAIIQDNVDYVFYFTPSDAWTPGNLMNGDSGLYSIDGHRKAAANTFAFYNDLESEIITPRANMENDKKKNTSGFVTKSNETGRVTALVFNYAAYSNSVDLKLDNLPYAGKNIKVTTKEINESSGNYYKDYADGIKGYDVTPNELPNETVSVVEGAKEYTDTLLMPSYSVVEVVLEPTDDSVSSPSLKKKDDPKINLAINKTVTSNSTGKDGVVEKNPATEDFDFSTIKEKTTETDSEQYLIETWSATSLTDGYRLSFDRTNSAGTVFGLSNLGYRSEAFESANNNVWVTVDLNEKQSINTVKLYPVSNLLDDGQGFPRDFTIQTSTDGENWENVYAQYGYGNGKVTGVQEFVFAETEARYVRLNATNLSEADGGYRLQLAELEVYNDPSAELTETEYVAVNAQAGKDSASITAYSDLDAVVIKASYKDDGTMENVTVTDTIKLTKGKNTVNFAEAVKEDDKIMVWDSLSGMKPYGSYTVSSILMPTPTPTTMPTSTPTASPDTTPKPTIDPNVTPKPNRLVDGDIEMTETLADSKWKPSAGEWKKGLGTSADIDTSIISDNSTKSVKITNAALLQSVVLEGGENYNFSFDIYLSDSFNKSKLSWGIFSLADNGYVGSIGCGYKEGAVVSESNFDENKKNEWQHIETEFLCASDATYVVEFLYGAPDSVYIDNVCVSGGKASAVIAEVHKVNYTAQDGVECSVYGTLYRPAGIEKAPVVIYSHGFSGSGDDFKSHCEFMARNGYAAYCYEFCGGSKKMQSKGRENTEMTIFTEKEDLLQVFDYLSMLDCIDTNNMFICGGSQGGLVTTMAAEELGSKAKAMAVYNPAIFMPDQWRSTYKNVSDIPEVTDLWGFKLGKVFFTSMRDYYPQNVVGTYPNNVLILQGDKDTTVPLSSSQYLQKRYKNATLNVYPGEGHSFKPAASQKAKEDILEFIKANTTVQY